ncbi:MAG TPA: hypothetical protein VGC91_08085 [Pyrinomonadaceae bacterium]|jgi:hypothetical protein
MSKRAYFIGRGSILVASRNADGSPGTLRDVGEAPTIEVNVQVDFAENFDTSEAISTQDLHVAIKQTGKLRLVLKEATAENLALALFGKSVDETTGTFTAVAFPTGIIAGETYQIPGARAKVSSIVIVDSAVTPATVTSTKYEVDADFGTVKFLDVSSYTQPFKISGTEAAGKKSIALLTKRSQELFIMAKLTNVANDDKKELWEFYRVALSPATKIDGKGDEVVMYEMEGNLLKDREKGSDPTFGYFGRRRLLE